MRRSAHLRPRSYARRRPVFEPGAGRRATPDAVDGGGEGVPLRGAGRPGEPGRPVRGTPPVGRLPLLLCRRGWAGATSPGTRSPTASTRTSACASGTAPTRSSATATRSSARTSSTRAGTRRWEHLGLPRHHGARAPGGMGGLTGGHSADRAVPVVELPRRVRRATLARARLLLAPAGGPFGAAIQPRRRPSPVRSTARRRSPRPARRRARRRCSWPRRPG